MIQLKIVLVYHLIHGQQIEKLLIQDLEYQVDIGSSANINSPKYLIVAHQTAARSGS